MIIELIPEQNIRYDKLLQKEVHLKDKYWCDSNGKEICVPGSNYAYKNLLPVYSANNELFYIERYII